MALIQLIATGVQDEYLLNESAPSFWRAEHRKHTNFAIEPIRCTKLGTAKAGSRLTFDIPRNGDLVYHTVLEITVQQTGPTWYPAEALIKDIELEIGSSVVDRHYGDWFRIYDELFREADEKEVYRRMTNFSWISEQFDGGNVQRKLYLPLLFSFCRDDPSLALPLIALQHHEVRIHVNIANNVDGLDMNSLNMELFADFVFVDVEERKMFASRPHMYLYEQLQYNGPYDARNGQHFLTFNHPVKYVAWVVGSKGNHGIYNTYSIKPTSIYGSEVAQTIYDNLHNDAFAIVKTATIQLNGSERLPSRSGSYFNTVVPYQKCRTNPVAGVYLWSFALDPKSQIPTGSCNFSRVDNASLSMQLKTLVSGTSAADATTDGECVQITGGATLNELRIYAMNWNVFRIQSGMGGMAWSN